MQDEIQDEIHALAYIVGMVGCEIAGDYLVTRLITVCEDVYTTDRSILEDQCRKWISYCENIK